MALAPRPAYRNTASMSAAKPGACALAAIVDRQRRESADEPSKCGFGDAFEAAELRERVPHTGGCPRKLGRGCHEAVESIDQREGPGIGLVLSPHAP